MQRLMRLRLGTKLLRSPTTITKPSLQSVCSNTLLSLSKTNPNHLNTYSAINHFHRFSSQFTTPPSPGSSVLEKIYGFVSNPVIVKKLLSYALVKGSGKGLGGDSIIAFLRAQLPKPFFEVQNRRWQSWFRGKTPDSVVLGLILTNVAVFMLWRIADRQFMLRNFTISVDNIKSGRVHTLITSAFSHIDVGHLISNMIGLYFFGMNIGRVFGSEFLLQLYFSGAVVGSIFYLVHHAFIATSSK
ncbi:RHOMBOID-like protein, partial [Actinidia chinensis var. chinensis]